MSKFTIEYANKRAWRAAYFKYGKWQYACIGIDSPLAGKVEVFGWVALKWRDNYFIRSFSVTLGFGWKPRMSALRRWLFKRAMNLTGHIDGRFS
ncbi:MAG: hypothetical protein ACREBC_38445 [Pyrinomonadaceae bacterium]